MLLQDIGSDQLYLDLRRCPDCGNRLCFSISTKKERYVDDFCSMFVWSVRRCSERENQKDNSWRRGRGETVVGEGLLNQSDHVL